MASWMNHEFLRDESMISYQNVEKDSELWIRVESSNPTKVIFRIRILTSDKDLIPTLMEKQQEAMEIFDIVVPERKSYAMEACFGRCKELTIELKRREPHSPSSLNISLFRASMCKDIVEPQFCFTFFLKYTTINHFLLI